MHEKLAFIPHNECLLRPSGFDEMMALNEASENETCT